MNGSTNLFLLTPNANANIAARRELLGMTRAEMACEMATAAFPMDATKVWMFETQPYYNLTQHEAHRLMRALKAGWFDLIMPPDKFARRPLVDWDMPPAPKLPLSARLRLAVGKIQQRLVARRAAKLSGEELLAQWQKRRTL